MKEMLYFHMRAFFYPREVEQCVTFKLEELEPVWYCNQKNVKRRLRKLEEEGMFRYQPGKGRGHVSQLVFARPFQDEVVQAVREYVKHGQLEEILQFMQLPIPPAWIVHVSHDVQKLFGYQSAPHARDILRTIVSNKVSTLDPLYASINLESYCIQQLGDTLVTYDAASDAVKPHLAHHWKADDEQAVWTFYLRKGVHFHHQRLLTSEDVAYTFKRFQQGNPPLQWLVQDIKEIECPTPYIVRFHLHRPNPLFVRYLSACNLAILPKDVTFDEQRWVGTGPFRLKKRTDTMLVLEAFDQYFGERPFLDEMEIYLVSDEAREAITYQMNANAAQVLQPPRNKADVTTGFRFLAFNFRRNFILHQRSFREALYHLLNVEKMWQDLGRKDLQEASSFFPWKSTHHPKDKRRVKPLLQESGYQGETLTLFAQDLPKTIAEAEWLVEEARSEGIQLQCVHFGMGEFYGQRLDTEADLLFLGEASSVDHHLSFLDSFYNRALIFRRFLDYDRLETIERFLEALRCEADKTKRECWIEQMEDYLRREHLILFKYHPVVNRQLPPVIQGSRFEAFGYDDFRKSWIE